MELDIRGLRAIVTAGAGGIGLAIARALVQEGARVHVCDVDDQALKALADTDSGITAHLTNVADRDAVSALFERAVPALGGLDVLVNNAGISGPTGPVEAISPDEWDRCIDLCLTSQFRCARLAVPHLKESANASIVNISSAAGRMGFPFRSPYASAKWGVLGFTKSLSRELGEYGIRVNAILPGIVEGDRQRRVLAERARHTQRGFEEVEAEMLSKASLRRYVTPQHIADYVAFLISPRCMLVSGQAISIDGDLQA